MFGGANSASENVLAKTETRILCTKPLLHLCKGVSKFKKNFGKGPAKCYDLHNILNWFKKVGLKVYN